MKYMIRVISASFYDENDYSMEFGKFQFNFQKYIFNEVWSFLKNFDLHNYKGSMDGHRPAIASVDFSDE